MMSNCVLGFNKTSGYDLLSREEHTAKLEDSTDLVHRFVKSITGDFCLYAIG